MNLEEYNINAATIRETWLKKENNFMMKNYTIYRTTRPGRPPAGGVMLVAKNRLKHEDDDYYQIENIENVVIGRTNQRY